MPDGAVIRITNAQDRLEACNLVQACPVDWLVRIGPPPRTLRQASRFWATCADVAQHRMQLGYDIPLDKQAWHDLFLSGFHVLQGKPPVLLFGLEGERVSLARHTRYLSETDLSELLEYTDAWCTAHGIQTRV